MKIRNQLYFSILPVAIIIICIGYWVCYNNWSKDIIEGYQERLQLSAIGCAQVIENDTLYHHHLQSSSYQKYQAAILEYSKHLPIADLYVMVVQPVFPGHLVLEDLPEGINNPCNQGNNPFLQYRKVFLFKNSDEEEHTTEVSSKFDFCQNNEQHMYYKPSPVKTPIYRSLKTGKKMLTAYAPIKDSSNNIIAFVGVDLLFSSIQLKIHTPAFLFGFFSLLLLGCTTAAIYFVSADIASPLEKLYDTALAIASGEYGKIASLEGAQETEQLADSFNIMSACLKEKYTGTIDIRSVSYNKTEATEILQKELFEQQIPKELCNNITAIHYWDSLKGKGRRLFVKQENSSLLIQWENASKEGLQGLLSLASSPVNDQKMEGLCFFNNPTKPPFSSLNTESKVYEWSKQTNTFAESDLTCLQPDTIIMISNNGFDLLLQRNYQLKKWLQNLFYTLHDQPLDLLKEALSQEIHRLVCQESTRKNIFIILYRPSNPVSSTSN